MLLSLITKELLVSLLTARYALAFFLIVSVSLASVITRTLSYEKLSRDYSETVSGHARTMSMIKSSVSSMQLGVTVERRPNPISIFVSGLENDLTRSMTVSDEYGIGFGAKKLSEPSFGYLPVIDMVFVTGVLCSLLALVLVFDSICGERETGTLRLMLSGPLPRDMVLVAKLVAGLFVVVSPLLTAWLANLVYVVCFARVHFTPDQMARIAAIITVSVVYASFFLAVGLSISGLCSRRSTALIYSLAFWSILVLTIPNIVPFLVKYAAPVPDPSQILARKDAIDPYINQVLWPKWHMEIVGSQKSSDWDRVLYPELAGLRQAELARRSDEIDRSYSELVVNQIRLDQAASRLSPFSCLVFAATDLAGCGTEEYLGQMSYNDTYARSVLETGKELLAESYRAADADPKMARRYGSAGEKLAPAFDRTRWPSYDPPALDLGRVIANSGLNIALLCAGAVLLFLVAFVAFLTYDAR